MDVKTSLAAQGYAQGRSAAQLGLEGSGGNATEATENPFAALASDFVDTVKNGEETAKAAMTGDADPHTLVQALSQTELAVEAAVTLRNKVVEAYQEILRMPV
ncbi:flagellar hook-basal body complex protein FliE [Thioclava sp. GXIMD4216]|uniref:Flagellar hook-basal body complex protein FliE n=1 Tax=Thioclava litoralis TaxID=3076557 RepID=A0ABZ1DXL4_9RHOB|nr:flagellar hook-basal body complex protein FliE [Thioclava sp. FTW29]